MIKRVCHFVIPSVSYICWEIVIRFLSVVQAWSTAELFGRELVLNLIQRGKSLLRLLLLWSLLDWHTLVSSLIHSRNLFIILMFIEYRFQSLTLQPRVVHWLKCGGWLVIESLLVKMVSNRCSLVVFCIMGCQVLLKSCNTLIVQIIGDLHMRETPWWVVVYLAIPVVLLL